MSQVLWIIAGTLGWFLHYITPQLRKQQPWLCLAGPVLKQHEHAQFEVTEPAKLMYFERVSDFSSKFYNELVLDSIYYCWDS